MAKQDHLVNLADIAQCLWQRIPTSERPVSDSEFEIQNENVRKKNIYVNVEGMF